MNDLITPHDPPPAPKVPPDAPIGREILLDRIDVEKLVVRGNRFFAPTKTGGSVLITLTQSSEKMIIRRIRPRDRSQPSAYVGRASRQEFLELLREVLALKKKKPC